MTDEDIESKTKADRKSRRSVLKIAGGSAALATMGGLAGCSGGGGGGGEETTASGGGGGGTETDMNGGGGGTTTGQSQSGVELRMWLSYITEGGGKKEGTEEVLGAWQEETGNTLNITGVPYTDVVSQFRSARAAGDVPHLVEVMTRPGVLTGGAGLVVNDLFESMELANVASDAIMDGHRVWGAQSTGEQGNLVTIPLGLRPFVHCWNTDHLRAAGIEKSRVRGEAMDFSDGGEVEDLYQQLIDNDVGQQDQYFPDTTGMKQSDEEYLSAYIPMHGGSEAGVVTVDGSEQAIDTPEGRAAVEWQFRNIDKGYFHENSINHGDEESTTLHQSGVITNNSIQDSTDLWANYRTEQPDAFEDGLYTWSMPYNAGTKAYISWLPCLGFMADANWNQARRDAAADMLDFWVAEPEQSLFNAQTLGFVPANPEAINEVDWFGSSQQHTEFWRESCLRTLNEVVPTTIPAVPGANAITYQIPRRMHQRVVQNRQQQNMSLSDAVADACARAGEEIQSVIDENQ